ncbi:hypothetical protein TNCV_1275881 [Trichonephila clavipes]|nr:hypothetical protein TNCV_1275881 [Trichonephila clavipes]
MANKDYLEFVQSSKNVVDEDSEDENEMNNTAPVPTSSKMRKVMKNTNVRNKCNGQFDGTSTVQYTSLLNTSGCRNCKGCSMVRKKKKRDF